MVTIEDLLKNTTAGATVAARDRIELVFEGTRLDSDKIIDEFLDTQRVAAETSRALDVFFVLLSGYLVFLMQAGFAMLTAGSVRSKNTKNVLLKNVLDACVGAIAYYLFGYAFAYGEDTSAVEFIGSGYYALSKGFGVTSNSGFNSFFFQWAFAATAATIVSGSVAERTSFYAYMAYAFFLTAFVYPVVSHWVWGGGFLATIFTVESATGPVDAGTIDFAGCSVVHMVGGFAGLTGAIVVGPRLGRFDSEGKVVPIPGHSATLATLGTFLLWFGWYGFNPGSALALSGGGYIVAERCAVTTTLAGATGGIVTLIVLKLRDHIFDLLACLNGILAGLVSITACCAFVHPYAAIFIGAMGALVYILATMVLLWCKVDDPLEAFPIHGAAGAWGALCPGLFNVREFQETAGLDPIGGDDYHGGLYGGGGRLFVANLASVAVIMVWTVGLVLPLFVLMRVLGILRISPEEEIIGNDVSKHGGVAYPIDATVAAEKQAAIDIDHLGMDDSLKTPNVTGVTDNEMTHPV
ncbi:Ammonium transporter 1 member 2 [Gracilariopsis chorda]|uniref:Ammonium transporter n=1 Tax=Gracilariopsis chorda TaxID=448386 RepID=A0A2V3IYK5_9FLOR|nr:Ammonium transporter 1 member 2 [Gracilariopsis chorda]|eukprot:PXF47143.1 Ammonium transporter 1 member 2 [Gracilariopsis chorda]